jgi:hypothetical protein
MTTDFRALCADMLFAVQLYTGQNPAASEMSSVEVTEKLMDAMAATAAALATPPPEPPTAIGPEWQPCVKLPIIVHVREQRPSETHSSTREGITPLRPDDLIMRGVQGEEYPIGRELFNQTYRMGEALATPPGPPKNCWLDDEPYLLPSPCVFDDPSEMISNCTYARTIKCKTDCKYYRT